MWVDWPSLAAPARIPALWAVLVGGHAAFMLATTPSGGGTGRPGTDRRDSLELEVQLEEIRREAAAESVCLMAFGPSRAQVLGTAGVSVADLDALRQWRPRLPILRHWQCVRQTQRDLTLVLCLKKGALGSVEKMASSYLLQWLATVVYTSRNPL